MIPLTREQMRRLVHEVIETRNEEIDCDEMMRVLTQYADKLAVGRTMDVEDTLVQHHLQHCVECREEMDMIRGIAEEGILDSDDESPTR